MYFLREKNGTNSNLFNVTNLSADLFYWFVSNVRKQHFPKRVSILKLKLQIKTIQCQFYETVIKFHLTLKPEQVSLVRLCV